MHRTQKMFALISTLALLGSLVPAQEPTRQNKRKTVSAAAASNPVAGGGTGGQITKWLGVDGSNTYFIGDSNITEDKYGKVGIGTRTPTSQFTVRGSIETTLGGFKFPDGTVQTTAFDPNQVVRSLNALTGDITLGAGINITITPSGNTLTIASPNSLTSVAHDATLAGSGTTASPLGVANGGIGNAQLANNAVTLSKIAPNQVVTSLNNLTEIVTLAAGSNITITPSGNTLTIAGDAGSSVAHHAAPAGLSPRLDAPGQDVISKTVPAGSYIIFFKTSLYNLDSDPQEVLCKVSTGDQSRLRLPGLTDGDESVLVLQDTATFSATTTITVHCTGFFFFAEHRVLTALKVDSIQ